MTKVMAQEHQAKSQLSLRREPVLYDRLLLAAVLALIILGLVMVASASIVVSERQFHEPFYFLIRQMANLLIGVLLANWLVRIEIEHFRKIAPYLLLLSLILLLLVLVPGIGRHINGSARWIGFGPIGLQVSELAKFSMILFLADYFVRHQNKVRTEISGFLKPMAVILVASILLLKEPDFGATSVMVSTALGMMFLAGVPLSQFVGLLISVVISLSILAISSPYRMQRLTVFLNPWANQYDSGYQLTQALIAFGRGGWSGVGLGESIQKLFYLPEAHTDFVFAVFAEEMGLLGVLVILILFALFVWRAFMIGREAELRGKFFSAYVAYGLALWIGMQATINIGVNSGLLPTKGLTLPFISYGGSSMIIMILALAFLFRVDYENRLNALRDFRSRYEPHEPR